MLMATTIGLVRALVALARRVDVELAETAARNAAIVVTERESRQIEDARTIRDLDRLGLADDGVPTATPSLPH
jgi:hypothetical protein